MKTHALILSAVLLTTPAFAQAIDSPRPSASADVLAEGTLERTEGIQLEVSRNMNFMTLRIPVRPSVRCVYEMNSSGWININEVDIATDTINEATAAGYPLTDGGCGIPEEFGIATNRGLVTFTSSVGAPLEISVEYASAGLPGVRLSAPYRGASVSFTEPDGTITNSDAILTDGEGRVSKVFDLSTLELAGLIYILGKIEISPNAEPTSGPVTLGTATVSLNYQ
jgi:hypothetical protein